MKLNDEMAEKYLQSYREHGLNYAYHNAELRKNESLLEFKKAKNLVSEESHTSVTQAKAYAGSNDNLRELMEFIAMHELEKEKAYTEMHYYRMKFEAWKAETFRQTNEEYFEKKVYAKT